MHDALTLASATTWPSSDTSRTVRTYTVPGLSTDIVAWGLPFRRNKRIPRAGFSRSTKKSYELCGMGLAVAHKHVRPHASGTTVPNGVRTNAQRKWYVTKTDEANALCALRGGGGHCQWRGRIKWSQGVISTPRRLGGRCCCCVVTKRGFCAPLIFREEGKRSDSSTRCPGLALGQRFNRFLRGGANRLRPFPQQTTCCMLRHLSTGAFGKYTRSAAVAWKTVSRTRPPRRRL